MIGIANGKIVAVEMKVNLSKQVIRQAKSARAFAHETWCAVRAKPREVGIQRCHKYGIGVLIINTDVSVVLAADTLKPWPPGVKYFLERCSSLRPGGVAGLPKWSSFFE